MQILLGLLLLVVYLQYAKTGNPSQPPHIVFIYADDLGWNDVSFHGSPQIPTPNIDSLGMNGVILNNYYGEYFCTPSRAALLTGKYPIRLGLQHFVIVSAEDSGLPIGEVILPQHLKKLGYDTHIVGKWHLGYSTKQFFPTQRGFDSFFGYVNGYIDYYDYTYYDSVARPELPLLGIDLYNNTEPVRNFRSEYATEVFADKAKNIILNHDTSKPLFLYVPQIAVHSGNQYQPHQAPPHVIEKFKYIKNVQRRIHAAVMSVLDNTVGTLFKALDDKDMLENSIVLFISDNGGDINPVVYGTGSNYPLRGGKATYWEGGVRLPALIWSPLLKLRKPRISKQFIHVTDLLPTLYSAAGGNVADLGKIDGIDMWQTLKEDLLSPRQEQLVTLDPIWYLSAYRRGAFKVVNGTFSKSVNDWKGPSGLEEGLPHSMEQWVFKDGSQVRDILQRKGMWINENPDSSYTDATITCQKPPPSYAYKCDPTVKPCLFNIVNDPCEYNDLADTYPEVVSSMMNRIYQFQREAAPSQSKPIDPNGDPMCHNFTYVPWLEPEYYHECSYAMNFSN